MKNKELDELKPIYIHETCYSPGDEINLLDLALVLVRRKALIGIILIIFIAGGTFYSMSQTDTVTTTYNYETSIFIGSCTANNKTLYLEPPATLLSNIRYIYTPLLLPSLEKKYTVSATLPQNSGVILLKTSSTEANDSNAINLLTAISKKAIAKHDKYYDAIRTSLISTRARLVSSEEPANLTDIALQLASLKKSSTLDKPHITKVESVKTAKSPKLIITISFFSGLLFAIFAAFFAEFISKVKQRTDEKSS